MDNSSDIEGAEEEYRETIKLNPDDVSSYINLANIIWNQGRLPEALELLEDSRARFSGENKKLVEERLERITQIEGFWEDVVLTMTTPKEIKAEVEYCGHEDSEEFLEDRLWGYAEGLMEEDEEEKRFWEKIKDCKYCLTKLITIQKALNKAQEEPCWSYKKIAVMIKKNERREKAEALIVKFKELIARTPDYLQKGLETVFQNLETVFQETFAYPTPSFAPVFGEPQVTVLSPFGKVRYPIVFEWQPYEEANKYIITIEDIDWSITTTKTKLEITTEDLELKYGQEYMWNLKAMKKDEILEEENGVFSLIDKVELKEIEQIENQIKEIEPEEERLILWGGILEEKELYVDAIQKYKQAYSIQPSPGVAYRIACCYDRLELEDLREEWNKRIPEEEKDFEAEKWIKDQAG